MEKKAILRKVDEVKKGKSKDLSFLDDATFPEGDIEDSLMTKKKSHDAKNLLAHLIFGIFHFHTRLRCFVTSHF